MTARWRAIVDTGISWLGTKQAGYTVMPWYAIRSPTIKTPWGQRYYTAAPIAAAGHPEIAVTVAVPRWDDHTFLVNPLRGEEITAFVDQVAAKTNTPVPDLRVQGGPGNLTVAVTLPRLAHRSLRAAYNRYDPARYRPDHAVGLPRYWAGHSPHI